MALLSVVGLVLAVVVGLVLLTAFICIKPDQFAEFRDRIPERLGVVIPSLAVLGGVLLLNSVARRFTEDLSWLIGINISALIFRIEGSFVAELQRISTPELTIYFSFVYVFGYVLLLVFPLIAYFLLNRLDTFHELTLAYTANYTIGLLCYLIFIAYGPRNLAVAEQFMYDAFPQFKLLTFAVNLNTNVFPSLHTSLSMTVMLFAWRTKSAYPRWLPIAVLLGTSVIASTMYLGIHWFIDVIGGIALGYLGYRIGIRFRDRWAAAMPKVSVDRPFIRTRI